MKLISTALMLCVCATASLRAQTPIPDSGGVPKLTTLVAAPQSELAGIVSRFSSDQNSLYRRYDVDDSPAQRRRTRDFYSTWQRRLAEIDFEKLTQEGKVDYVLLHNYLTHQLALLDRGDSQRTETASLIPFGDRLLALQDTRRNLTTIDSRAASSTLAAVATQVDSLRAKIESPPRADSATRAKISKTVANRAADNIDEIRGAVTNWYKYYDGYDPSFSWWTKSPYKKLDDALKRYAKSLREKIVGFKPGTDSAATNEGPIIGDPISA